MKNTLLNEITKYSGKYEFSFQFWGMNNNNVWIHKDGVELYSSGGHSSNIDAIIAAFKYIYRINRVKMDNRIC